MLQNCKSHHQIITRLLFNVRQIVFNLLSMFPTEVYGNSNVDFHYRYVGLRIWNIRLELNSPVITSPIQRIDQCMNHLWYQQLIPASRHLTLKQTYKTIFSSSSPINLLYCSSFGVTSYSHSCLPGPLVSCHVFHRSGRRTTRITSQSNKNHHTPTDTTHESRISLTNIPGRSHRQHTAQTSPHIKKSFAICTFGKC